MVERVQQRSGVLLHKPDKMSGQFTDRPFVFSVVEDDAENVIIEISEEDYQADLAAGIDEEDTMRPGRYKMKRGGFLARHPELRLNERESK